MEVICGEIAYIYVLFGAESVSKIRKFHMVTDGSYTCGEHTDIGMYTYLFKCVFKLDQYQYANLQPF